MTLRFYTIVALFSTVACAACGDDPTNEGSGEPFAIVADRTQVVAAQDVSFSLAAYTIDRNNRRIPGRLEGQVASGAIRLDSTVYVGELSETRFFMHGTTPTDGVDLTITGHGLTKNTVVVIE